MTTKWQETAVARLVWSRMASLAQENLPNVLRSQLLLQFAGTASSNPTAMSSATTATETGAWAVLSSQVGSA